ncbi:MAG: leucine--tRNA ligase [Lentisphaerae bacterium]|nr:leucine--tRNA ligase [Lentisphaerota bacterium]
MAESTYDFRAIEAKWQQHWEDDGTFIARDDDPRPGYYCLTMYPYPSGVLHAGHLLAYTISDVIVRQKKMRGFNVLCPMGWDSFGLPAENAAIKAGVPPKENVAKNIGVMRRQMRRAGWGFDWSREVATSHPGYYKWTQWFFARFYEKGLAFKKMAPVNWCPSCQTVVANEQVIGGQCERCSTEIEQRDLKQWFFKMSAYAQRLLDGHKELAGWPERVLKMQEEWVGRSEGARVEFVIAETDDPLPIFTTRPDTLWGVTFMSLAPEHPLIEKLVKGTGREAEVMAAVREMRKQGTSEREMVDLEKVGVWTGCHVINPVNGKKAPLWVANFALMAYGTGAVMAVPAHDQRDFEFARMYGLPIEVVIKPAGRDLDPAAMTEAYVDEGVMVDSGPFDGRNNFEAIPDICAWLAKEGKGDATINYRLRDWLISRQRYWGCPIPIVYCDDCGEVLVPDGQLPVLLPNELDDYAPEGKGPLEACDEFVSVACPKCGKPARRETDTIDTFIDSSWYFLRYLSSRDESQPFAPEAVKQWMPVDQYTGGIEHATMHLIYFRFFTMVLHDLGLIDFDEPAPNLFCQGMVCKTAHYCTTCKWLHESDVNDGVCAKCGGAVQSEMTKVSKTKLNTIDPDAILDEYGADAMRLTILSDTPPDRDQPWSDDGLDGSGRFLRRLWNAIHENLDALKAAEPFDGDPASLQGDDAALCRAAHQTIKAATENYEVTRHFNTAIARVFELMNAIKTAKGAGPAVLRLAYETVIKILAPITPHIGEELWEALGSGGSITEAAWPELDDRALVTDTVELAVQVTGKVRARIAVPADATEDEICELALADPDVQKYTDAKQIVKVIVVPGRLVNIVAK